MASQSAASGIGYVYDPFANNREYQNVNRGLVGVVNKLLPTGLNGARIADVACGTGLIARLCCEVATPAYVACSDISPEAVAIARETLAPYSGKVGFDFFAADARRMPQLQSGSIDVVFGLNFIHLVEDKSAVFQEVSRVLAPGGYVAVNTAFHKGDSKSTPPYQGWLVPGTMMSWGKWRLLAGSYIAERGLFVEVDHTESVAKDQQLTPSEYFTLLRESGLEVVHDPEVPKEVPVWLDNDALRGISHYDVFVTGTMRVDMKSAKVADSIRNASVALVETVDAAFTKGGVHRNWLQIVAQKV